MPTLFSTKFIRLIKTLQEEEWKEFETWLQSPWCNSNKNLVRLLAVLKKYYPDFTDHKLTKEKLFRQVLPNGKFSDRSMNNLLSEAYLAAERFLAFQRFSKDQLLQKDLLTVEFQQRHLDDWFFKESRKTIEQLERQELKTTEDRRTLFRFYYRVYHHPNPDPKLYPGPSPISQMRKQLDLYYLLEKAAIINEKITRSRVLHQQSYDLVTEINKWNYLAEGLEHPAIDLYRMRFAKKPEDQLAQYWTLRQTLLDRLDQLSEKVQKIQLLSLINDTMELIKAGRLDITENLPLYQLGLKKGILLQQGKLTRNTYSMIVMAANTKGIFDFTTQFIENYTVYLDEADREDCYHWARAHTAYWQKELEVCLAILQVHDFKSAYFQLVCRVLNAQVYFDLLLQDDTYQFFLFNFLDAFEKWLTREKTWSEQNKKAFLRFVQKCRKLAKLFAAVEFNPSKVEKLLDKAQNIQALNWLKQKQEEVLKIRSKHV